VCNREGFDEVTATYLDVARRLIGWFCGAFARKIAGEILAVFDLGTVDRLRGGPVEAGVV